MDARKWAAPARATRPDDTARSVEEQPIVFAHRRASADLAPITGRVLPARREATEQRGDSSASGTVGERILFLAGADVRREDRLSAPGGSAYRVLSVAPDQTDRTVVAVEVLSR